MPEVRGSVSPAQIINNENDAMAGIWHSDQLEEFSEFVSNDIYRAGNKRTSICDEE